MHGAFNSHISVEISSIVVSGNTAIVTHESTSSGASLVVGDLITISDFPEITFNTGIGPIKIESVDVGSDNSIDILVHEVNRIVIGDKIVLGGFTGEAAYLNADWTVTGTSNSSRYISISAVEAGRPSPASPRTFSINSGHTWRQRAHGQ